MEVSMAAKILRFTGADFQTLHKLIDRLDALSTVAENATDSDPENKVYLPSQP